jgi:hypothetical protein
VCLDTSIPPEKTIQLGQIITDPRNATSRFAPPVIPRPGEFSQSVKDRKFRVNKSINVNGKVVTHFLNIITFGLAVVFKKQTLHQYKIDNYTTHQFEPTPDYVNDAMKDVLRLRKRKNLYMIVGLQVADSARVYHLLDNTKGGGAHGGAPIATTGVEIAGHLDMTKEFQMSDEIHITEPFVFAYRIRPCIRQKDVYRLRSGAKLPPHDSPKLYDTEDRISNYVADDPQFKLSRIDGNEDMIEGQYHVNESMDGGNSIERLIILQEHHPWWLYYTPAIGILFYAWLIHYLVGKAT